MKIFEVCFLGVCENERLKDVYNKKFLKFILECKSKKIYFKQRF